MIERAGQQRSHHAIRSRIIVALLVLALVIAGCSGPTLPFDVSLAPTDSSVASADTATPLQNRTQSGPDEGSAMFIRQLAP